MKSHGLKADVIVPLGGSMRATFLQKIVEEELGGAVSMTANMDEEIATGDARISYLLAEDKGLAFDARLKGECVFASEAYEERIFAAEPKEGGVFVTCDEEYLECVKSHRYKEVENEEAAKERESGVCV